MSRLKCPNCDHIPGGDNLPFMVFRAYGTLATNGDITCNVDHHLFAEIGFYIIRCPACGTAGDVDAFTLLGG